ncbi:hypothetical protein, partial [Leyella stercorea]|uniref:hypothetical protein n=1 Tax=Leyella stercorea TaxID=363265 RepID=UPI001F3E27AA
HGASNTKMTSMRPRLKELNDNPYIGTHVHINIQKKRMRRTSESASHPPWIFSTYHKIAAADRILLKIIDK